MKSRITVHNKRKFYKYMDCLAIEMTRRCNMACRFCSKGKAQNIEITHEIIDKTFDELEDVYIECLRISGGEPFLAAEQIKYLIEKIIAKHIHIRYVCIFTNGTRKEEGLILPFIELLDYLHSIENEASSLDKWSENNHMRVYNGTETSKLAIVISTNGHDITESEVQDTIAFYCQRINDNDFAIVSQTDTFNNGVDQITLEGNARDNFRELLNNPCKLDDARILDNNFAFVKTTIAKDKDDFLYNVTLINKTLTISANGNVFPGCLMEYNRVDKEFMFNIVDCNSNFFDKVIAFCWEHPLNKKANEYRTKFKTHEFLLDHGFQVDIFTRTDTFYVVMCVINDGVNQLEQIMKDMHGIFPYFNFTDIEAVATVTFILKMFEENYDRNIIELFARYCTELEESDIERLSPEWCRGFILFMSEKNNELARSAAQQ